MNATVDEQKNDERELFSALAESMSAAEMQLAVLKGIIASEISIRRIKRGMSQKDLAKAMGVTQGMISRWEKGEANYTLSTLVDIAEKLDIQMQSPYVPSFPANQVSKRGGVYYSNQSVKWITQTTASPETFNAVSPYNVKEG